LTLLLLLAVAPVMYVRKLRAYRREMTFLAVSLVVLLLSVMTSHLDIGVRHALPLYPFAVVLGGASAWALTKTWRVGGYAVVALMLFQVVSSLRTFPDYLAYANEGFGGPNRAYRVLADSNVDWGQQLKEVSDYVRNNHVQECWFAYSLDLAVSPERYGIPCKQLPNGFGFWIEMPQPIVPTRITGVVLVGASDASGVMWGGGDMNPYRQFLEGRPERMIGSTVLVYQGSYDIPLAAAQAHFSQVHALLRQGKATEALAEARQAAALAPEAAEVQVELGGTLKALHQNAEAAEAFKEAMKLAKAHRPDDQSTQVAALIAAAVAPRN
jgi:tetratricopeptide (TPR) repeat protein